MLDDRHYMRPDYRPERGGKFHVSMTILMMVTLVVAFAIQQMDTAYGRGVFFRSLVLVPADIAHGRVWELLTFQFLHGSLLHLGFNLVGLWCFGQYVETRLGRWHFLTLYFLGGIAGGILQSLLGVVFPGAFGFPVLGASAGICGLLSAFCILEPEGIILVMFIIPLKARYLLYISTGVALFFTLVPTDPTVANAAHLGGLLFGVYYVRRGVSLMENFSNWKFLRRRTRSANSGDEARLGPFSKLRPKKDETTDLPPQEFMSQEVDPILDKISAHGIQSLTDRERQILQAARNRMYKR